MRTRIPFAPRPRRSPDAIALALLGVAALSLAGGAAAGAWPRDDDGLTLEASRTIAFTTREGTYMNVDVSPDGATIVFDLLGDIYTLPIGGGEASRVTSGLAHDIQPVWSPDGSRIAFISDRSGSDNIWTVQPDGDGLQAITDERRRSVSVPEWSPDGDYLLARRGGELWLYHVDGGDGLELSDDELAQGPLGPTFDPSGRYVYFSATSGGFAQGLSRINGWQVRRLDRVTGDVATVTASPNGAFRPRVSPDGRWLIFGARVDAKTGLRARDLRSGRERWLAWPIDRDNAERPGTLDLMPRYDFTADGGALVIAIGGTFQRLSLDDGDRAAIAFSADVELDLGPLVFFPGAHDDGPLAVRNVRYASSEPGGDRVVFSALARLWWMRRPDGEPQPLLDGRGYHHPTFSPDGRRIAFVSWDDDAGGHVWTIDIGNDGVGSPIRLTEHPGYYQHPAWSPDGSRLAFLREDAATFRNIWTRNTGEIVWVDSRGGPVNVVTSAPSDNRITFSQDGERVAYVANVRPGSFNGDRPAESDLVSVRLDGTDKRTLATIRAETWEAVPSPDGRWIAWVTREDVYVAALPLSPRVPEIGERSGPGPVRRISREGGVDIHWEEGSQSLAWTFGDTYYRIGLQDALADPEPANGAGEVEQGSDRPGDPGAVAADDTGSQTRADGGADEAPAGVQPDVLHIGLQAPRYAPQGVVALVGATVISMNGTEVIDDAVVVVRNNRIRAVGPRATTPVPAEATVFDVSGKTIIPGLIDLHAHLRPPREVFVQTSWAYLANLAYGVTSTRDVSTSNDSFAYGELVETGAVLGPRIYSTGRAMTTGNARIESLEDARHMVRHYKRLGTDVIKQYMQPHRRQRQWVIQAALEEGMNVTNEGGGDLRLDITQILDGYTGVEHSLPIADVYDDVVQLVARSGTWYTPTLVVSYGGPTAEWYFYQTTEVHDDEKLSRFTPHDDLDRRTRRGQMNALDEYHFVAVSEAAARILQAGGRVGLGAHGEQQGICAHWELWALQMGGLSNHDALRTATSIAAEGLGRLDDLGTIEPGKLADLVVLDANPLENIRNSNTIRWVMKNGELFDGDSLDEVWPERTPRPSIGYRDVGGPPNR